ncbi:hypothetical protein UY3_12442 [Chelonia mydas]|uniref:Uncharacterized protein n=1 Tax=Chelonia mydas TaxID=8469 RepID=M7AY43_CHEMY|nr:hypothetical protein UY3_12442 [Chelonia mydas]
MCKAAAARERGDLPQLQGCSCQGETPLLPSPSSAAAMAGESTSVTLESLSKVIIGQTGQSLRKRINGHKSDVKNYNIHKPVGEHFNLCGHTITDMKVAILQQKNFKTRLQRETVELEFICKLDTINLGLNRDLGGVNHYARRDLPDASWELPQVRHLNSTEEN